MSLKDAIREAVDERDKQGNQANDLYGDQPAANSPAEDQKERAVNTANSKTVNTAKNHSPQKPLQAKLEAKAERKETNPGEVSEEGARENQETAALTVRVSRRHRIHWLISAKQQNTSLTAAITEALNARFGEPLSGE